MTAVRWQGVEKHSNLPRVWMATLVPPSVTPPGSPSVCLGETEFSSPAAVSPASYPRASLPVRGSPYPSVAFGWHESPVPCTIEELTPKLLQSAGECTQVWSRARACSMMQEREGEPQAPWMGGRLLSSHISTRCAGRKLPGISESVGVTLDLSPTPTTILE